VIQRIVKFLTRRGPTLLTKPLVPRGSFLHKKTKEIAADLSIMAYEAEELGYLHASAVMYEAREMLLDIVRQKE